VYTPFVTVSETIVSSETSPPPGQQQQRHQQQQQQREALAGDPGEYYQQGYLPQQQQQHEQHQPQQQQQQPRHSPEQQQQQRQQHEAYWQSEEVSETLLEHFAVHYRAANPPEGSNDAVAAAFAKAAMNYTLNIPEGATDAEMDAAIWTIVEKMAQLTAAKETLNAMFYAAADAVVANAQSPSAATTFARQAAVKKLDAANATHRAAADAFVLHNIAVSGNTHTHAPASATAAAAPASDTSTTASASASASATAATAATAAAFCSAVENVEVLQETLFAAYFACVVLNHIEDNATTAEKHVQLKVRWCRLSLPNPR